ncbi:teichoic acid D-Ala incorporation-associated protein DltX [Ectobacillus sp. sgz5001026]|uniref:teichoic acid D-Ala incorporation-associated protein DltX n=1 Tax=Ectobacillus sp. sgz5001026 TaxID=3242473 RepID=UPI0036D36835
MNQLMKYIHTLWCNASVRWAAMFLFYVSILFVLTYLYGFVNQNTDSKFIYNEF